MDQATLRRYLVKVQVQENGCWIWTAAKSHNYGNFWYEGFHWKAHKVSYFWMTGIKDVELDHFYCDEKMCVNPLHVRPSTRLENNQRANKKETCIRGHDWSDVYIDPRTGQRKCRECYRAWKKERRLLGDK